ncbi:MAG: lysozyme inhibitor LprI family protein [Thiohalomonadales bacterium]
MLKMILFLVLSLVGVSVYGANSSFVDSVARIYRGLIPDKPGVLEINGGSIVYKDGQLNLIFKDKTIWLGEEAHGQQSGSGFDYIELWNTRVDGYFLIVSHYDWSKDEHSYDTEYHYSAYRITEQKKGKSTQPPRAIHLGLFNFEKAGLQDGPSYRILLKKINNYEFIFVNSACDNYVNIEGCENKVFSVDFINNKITLSSKKLFIISPSYNCTGRLSNIEEIICNSEVLSNLDQILAKAYKANNTKSKKSEQRKWLKQRNLCYPNDEIYSCLVKSYNSRIGYFINSP